MYYYKFEEMGGYDNCWSAFEIYSTDTALMCVVDVANWDNGKDPGRGKNWNAYWDWCHRRDPAAEQFAAMMCQRLNA